MGRLSITWSSVSFIHLVPTWQEMLHEDNSSRSVAEQKREHDTREKVTRSNEATLASLLVQLTVKNHKEYMQRHGKFVSVMFEKIGVQVAALGRKFAPANFRVLRERRDRNRQAHFVVPMEL